MEDALVCVYVCPLIFSETVHPIDFALGGCIAAESRKYSVKCELLRATGHIY